jgi:hypothetical protein
VRLEAKFEHALFAGLLVYGEPDRAAVVEQVRQAPVRAQRRRVARPGRLDGRGVSRRRFVLQDNFAREAVSVTVHSANEGLGLILQGGPQFVDAAGDDRFGHHAVRPDAFHQLCLGDELPGMAHQLGQHFERFGLDPQWCSPAQQLVAVHL